MTKRLYREEGLIVGPSTGAIGHAIDSLTDFNADLVVGISPDGGFKHASYIAEVLGDEGVPA